LIPSIDIMDGRAVQLRRGRELVIDAGDPFRWLDKFAVAGEVAIIDLDAALGRGSNRELIQAMVRLAPCRVGGGIRSAEAARQWLTEGAAKVIIGTAASPSLLSELPKERVIVAVDAVAGEVVVDGWRSATGRGVVESVRQLAPYAGGFLFTQVDREGSMEGFDRGLALEVIEAAAGTRVTVAGGIHRAEEIAWLDRHGADAQVGMALYSGQLVLADAIAAPLDGGAAPWPTIVSDESGQALGLVWSNMESLRRAIEERRGIYWSRSRNRLWYKGATSGNVQELLRVDLDCDRDAIRFVVRQAGEGFCHRGSWSCWDQGFGFSQLERLLIARLEKQSADSLTARLHADPTLLRMKLLEEAEELAQATGLWETVHEAADLLYFTMVALISRGARLADLLAELGRRRGVRRSGGEKEPRDRNAATNSLSG
jgi:phosphoribosyl-ATP pyrophosphohydrolase